LDLEEKYNEAANIKREKKSVRRNFSHFFHFILYFFGGGNEPVRWIFCVLMKKVFGELLREENKIRKFHEKISRLIVFALIRELSNCYGKNVESNL
jgi:hypothetical protein